MVYVNKDVLKDPLGILKIITMVMSLLIACLIGYMTGPTYANDRFNFMVTYGLLLLIWSLVTFLLYLCDVATKCKAGNMRAVEMVAAVFLLLLGAQCMVYAIHSATFEKAKIDEYNLKLRNAEGRYYDVMDLKATEAKKAEKDFNDRNKMHALHRDLNAAAATFIIVTLITLSATIFIVSRSGVPGTPHVEGAYVEGGAG